MGTILRIGASGRDHGVPFELAAITLVWLLLSGCHQSRTVENEPENMPMTVTDITPDKVRQLLEHDGKYAYLDVRTVEEFSAGRPPGAFNIPLGEINPATGRMEANPGFLQVVQSKFPTDAQLIVGCKSGGRSARAADMLRAAGYRNVINMVGGFSGVPGHGSEMVEPGWSTLGYPVETGDAGERSYQSLSKPK